MPKVSVIIPIYGVEKYIERCAKSLFEQTLDDIEFIFVDDCTPDRSMEILSRIIKEYRLRFAEKNYVVRTERMPTNSGLPAVRRHGIQLCTGDYIIHCDSDDWVEHTMYEEMYNKAKEEEADMVVCGYQLTDGKEILASKRGYLSENKWQYLEDLFYQRVEWPVWNRLVCKKVYQQVILYPNGNMGEDMVLTLQYVLSSNKITFVDECLYNYFYNPDSITHTQSVESIIKKYKQSCENFNILNQAIAENTHSLIKYGLQWLYFRTSNTLVECIADKDVKKLWRSHFNGRNMEFLSHPHIPILRKLRHIYLLIRCL